jgi:hypothetical protein
MRALEKWTNTLYERIAAVTQSFRSSLLGQLFMGVTILGPLTFLPTLWQVHMAADVEALKTVTWPLMCLLNISGALSMAEKGDWRMRFVVLIWIAMLGEMSMVLALR